MRVLQGSQEVLRIEPCNQLVGSLVVLNEVAGVNPNIKPAERKRGSGLYGYFALFAGLHQRWVILWGHNPVSVQSLADVSDIGSESQTRIGSQAH